MTTPTWELTNVEQSAGGTVITLACGVVGATHLLDQLGDRFEVKRVARQVVTYEDIVPETAP